MNPRRWPVLLLTWAAFAGHSASAFQLGTRVAETPAACPPVVQGFLEAVGLLPDQPPGTPPVVVLDAQGNALDCLERTLPPRTHAAAVELTYQIDQIRTLDAFAPELKGVCTISQGHIGSSAFISVLVSYDLTQMTSANCLKRARSSLNRFTN